MDSKVKIDSNTISSAPLKSFFVSMLTRDIDLEDAILDLLDNCIDGILRSKNVEGDKPYAGYWANIQIDADSFTISDNCGGIPWNLHDYAFRMGRPPDRQADVRGSVGYYGIGMKRAIFKMGTNCRIKTKSGNYQYEIYITPEWLHDESTWNLPVENIEWDLSYDGTIIEICNLNNGIAKTFDEDGLRFKSKLEKIISTQYAFIIEKGFEVRINDHTVKARNISILCNLDKTKKIGISPYIYEATTSEGIDVFLMVGFSRPIPSQSELDAEGETPRYSSDDAGWTVICNDRVVVYCDRTELTGWGEAGVPRYHTQFIAISGIVEFRSEDPGKLPTTTTKRGLDASSAVYLQVKNKMREGMKIFTSYTNQWKGQTQESKKYLEKGVPSSLSEIKTKSKDLTFNPTKRSAIPGKQFVPDLPKPKSPESTKKRITYLKERKKILKVAEYLGDPNLESSEVGENCFDLIYEEAKK